MENSDLKIKNIQEKWRKEYDKTVFQKLNDLKSLIHEFQIQVKEESLQKFRMEIHKMAGSAGTVGYMAVSAICKELDADLTYKLEVFKKNPPSQEWIAELTHYINRISEGFAKPDY